MNLRGVSRAISIRDHVSKPRIGALHNVLHQRRGNTQIAHSARPFRLAIIGAGPAGFYTAARVFQRLDNAYIDMYEQLPVPFGLVRFGVAPDHPEVKNCQDRFSEVASSSRFQFIGNTTISESLPLTALAPHYDAILLSHGATQDRALGIPGEDLAGIYSARSFVGWYNGIPEQANLAPGLDSTDTAVIIGQGNVALDVARTLLSPIDRLRHTDISEPALEALSKSRIKHVRVIGRRGLMQAAFTIKEARELLTLPSVGFEPIDPGFLPTGEVSLPRAQKRIAQLFVKHSTSGAALEQSPKSWTLDFLLSPIAFDASSKDPTTLASVTFASTAYATPAERFSPTAMVTTLPSTAENSKTIAAGLAFRSIGYKSAPIAGMTELGIPFDAKRGIIPNDGHGRVLSRIERSEEGRPAYVKGVYCAGWVKTGPTGVIASTMEDAFSVAEAIVSDWIDSTPADGSSTGELGEKTTNKHGWQGLRSTDEGKRLDPVSWDAWLKIDAAERERGRPKGKEREKFLNVEDMLAVVK